MFSRTLNYIGVYPCRGVINFLLAGVLREFSSRVAVRLFFGQFLHVFPHQSLELALGTCDQQPQSQVHVGEQRRERPTSLQRILCAFLYPRHITRCSGAVCFY